MIDALDKALISPRIGSDLTGFSRFVVEFFYFETGKFSANIQESM
jgi:hypothetical protein